MKVSDEIIDALKECNIPVRDALPYLITLHLGYEMPTYIPEKLERQINASGIVKPGKGSEGLIWQVPLFEGNTTDFDWVYEWVALFTARDKSKAGNARMAKARMKKFFASNPQFRKDDVFLATKMYIRSVDNSKYMMLPHYFIQKGAGIDAKHELLEWCERLERAKKYAELNGTSTGDKSNTMRT